MSIAKAVACIKKYNNFLVTTHTNPEGDALGSEFAFVSLLNKLGKTTIIMNEDVSPPEYDFISANIEVKKYKSSLKKIDFDCFVFLDCADLKRTGEVYRINIENKPILNIDHHISNSNFGSVNWIEPDSSCCAEMVYKLYKRLNIPLDKEAALCLYTGILSDTGSFRYSNTTSFTHQVVSELLKEKLDIPQIYRNIYEDIPYQGMKLVSRVLSGMKRYFAGKVVSFEIKQKLLKNEKLTFDLSDEVLRFGRAIKGIEAVVLFKENLGIKNEIRVNLRSRGLIDVNKIASFFNGGGHKTASGATIKGELKQVKRMVLTKISEALA
ncbi:MAG: bifunctional oligoribonuclease/PAP phosphatase NrnA [Candidatus Omnitrophota bacterium]|nr:bifunctional oligoribonuclease/PAP phosphatase NrnA [Candidatus Omnitrophota bacterium]